MALHRDLAQYCVAVYGEWVSFVSGVGSIALLIILAFWGDQVPFLKDNQKAFVWLGVIGLFVAGFAVWNQIRPKLTFEIKGVWVQLNAFGFPTIDPMAVIVVFKVVLVNTRPANNAIKRYELTVEMDKRPHKSNIVPYDDLIEAKTGKQALNLEAVKRSILIQGHPVEGYVCFEMVDEIDVEAMRYKKFVLTATDAYDVPHKIKGRLPSTDTKILSRKAPQWVNDLYRG